MPLPFVKMHGLGNDFVIVDGREKPVHLKPEIIRRLADRHLGIGCDQLIVLEPPRNAAATLFMAIYNNDGSRAGACGNAMRCVAHMVLEKSGQNFLSIETDAGILRGEKRDGGLFAVDMGPPSFEWKDVPLAYETNTLSIDTGKTGLPPAVAVSMGNPHAVFFMQNVETIDLAGIGPQIENHPLFPERTNVEFAEILDPNRIRMRVWERGTGITQACGSGACAVLAAAVRRDLSARRAELVLDGGSLHIEWLEDNHIQLIGPASYSFSGVIPDALLAEPSHD
jgi:diaminopimelate epimerase